MKKKNRNPYSKVHDYSKYASKWKGVEIPSDDERYYGIHRDGNRVKIDIKRMKKIGTSGVPVSVLDAASSIPRNTTYFLPKRLHRHDYVINQFRDKLAELTASWREYKTAFGAITSPTDVAEQVRLERLNSGLDDNEDATVAGIMSGARRQATYNKLWISQCAQFIHQMATELDALMLRKCVYLGYARKDVSRGSMHDYLNGTMKGRARIESLKGYDVYAKFFTVWNMLKHNSEDLFEKIQKNYPDMLLTTQYHNGEMSQYYRRAVLTRKLRRNSLRSSRTILITKSSALKFLDVSVTAISFHSTLLKTKNLVLRSQNPNSVLFRKQFLKSTASIWNLKTSFALSITFSAEPTAAREVEIF